MNWFNLERAVELARVRILHRLRMRALNKSLATLVEVCEGKVPDQNLR